MKIKVCSIDKILFEGEAKKCIARTSLGEITVLDGHIPLISFVDGGIKIVHQDTKDEILSTKETSIPISFGFIEVQPPKNYNGKVESEIVVLVADPEASKPLSSIEIAHKVV